MPRLISCSIPSPTIGRSASTASGYDLNLVTVYRLLTTPEYLGSFGSGPLHAQANLLLHSFRYDWSISLVIFGIHLVLLGCLIYHSGYIPKIIGFLLILNG